MAAKYWAFVLLMCASVCGADDWRRQVPSQIPRTVYVGDRAMLVLPLPEHSIAADIEPDPRIYASDDLEVHRIAIEKRGGGSRLLIEFTAYAPGRFTLPPFEAGGLLFSGLYLDISSVLADGEPPVLSGLAPPLSAPGTGFLVYGSMTLLIVLITAVLWVLLRGRPYLKRWLSVWRKRRLIFLLARCEKRMGKALAAGKSLRTILDSLSAEFRSFLSMFSGTNCFSMTPAEFEQCAVLQPELDSGFLLRFFSRCDELRFAGSGIDSAEVQSLLGELRGFILMQYKALRGTRLAV